VVKDTEIGLLKVYHIVYIVKMKNKQWEYNPEYYAEKKYPKEVGHKTKEQRERDFVKVNGVLIHPDYLPNNKRI